MMNFCLLTLLLWAIRKLLWLIDSNMLNSVENKIKEVFSFVTDILYFILCFIAFNCSVLFYHIKKAKHLSLALLTIYLFLLRIILHFPLLLIHRL